MKTERPYISIITVCYNSEKTISETIKSVLNQSYDNYEYLVIDGLSTDRTVLILESYREEFKNKNIKYTFISENDNGIYDAMNKGISMSGGEIVGIINSDDYYNLDTLEKVAKFYCETEFDIMYGDLRIFNDKKDFVKKSKITKKFNTRYWNHPTTFITKKVYDDHKYVCQSIYDDLNFMLESKSKGFKICILNEILANFRLGGISNERSFSQMKARIKLRNKIYKQNNCKGYKFNNFIIEMAKYFLSK